VHLLSDNAISLSKCTTTVERIGDGNAFSVIRPVFRVISSTSHQTSPLIARHGRAIGLA